MSEDRPTVWQVLDFLVVSILLGATFCCCFFLFALLRLKKIRTDPFNLYVVFLIIPDTLYTLIIACVSMSDALKVPMFPPYEVVSFTNFFYYAANFYMNVVVTYEINKLVTQSYRRQRTPPPALSRVYKQVVAVFSFAIFMGLWASLPVSFALWHIKDREKNIAELGSPQGGLISKKGGFAISFAPALIAIIYVLYVRIRIGRKKLLPRKGRTRVLSLFFLRIVIVFLFFYLPNSVLVSLNIMMVDLVARFWIRLVRGILTACQALITLYLCAEKDDIRKAVRCAYNRTFGLCCCGVLRESSGERRRNENHPTRISGLPQSSGASNEWNQSDVYSSKWNSRISATFSKLKLSSSARSDDHDVTPSIDELKVYEEKESTMTKSDREQKSTFDATPSSIEAPGKSDLGDEEKEVVYEKESTIGMSEWEQEDEYEESDQDEDEQQHDSEDPEQAKNLGRDSATHDPSVRFETTTSDGLTSSLEEGSARYSTVDMAGQVMAGPETNS